LNFKQILEETVASSAIGRILASYGSKMIGREKRNARLLSTLLNANKKAPSSYAIVKLTHEKKKKKYTYTQAVEWFQITYPKEAEPLLSKLNEEYNTKEKAIVYGLKKGKNFPDEYYVKVLEDLLEIPSQEAIILYHGVLKPFIGRVTEEGGLIRLVVG